MPHSDDDFRHILRRTKVVAIVGMSANPRRPSHQVAMFLQAKGMRIVPVNPGLEGQMLLGEKVYAHLKDIPLDVDMVDIFRKSEAVPDIVQEALGRWPKLPTLWLQIGVQHDEAAEIAKEKGVDVVQNRCPKIEYARLFSD